MDANRPLKGRKGFTLVELVAVMVTLGVLLTAALSFLLFSANITARIEKATRKNDTLRSALTRIKQEASVSAVTWLCDTDEIDAVLAKTDWGASDTDMLVVFETDGGDTLESKRVNGTTGAYEDTPGKTVVIYGVFLDGANNRRLRPFPLYSDTVDYRNFRVNNYIADLKRVRFSLSGAGGAADSDTKVVSVRFYDTDAAGADAFLADDIYMPNMERLSREISGTKHTGVPSPDYEYEYQAMVIKPAAAYGP